MTDVAERIWARMSPNQWASYEGRWQEETSYIRADLHAAVVAERDELAAQVAALQSAGDELMSAVSPSAAHTQKREDEAWRSLDDTLTDTAAYASVHDAKVRLAALEEARQIAMLALTGDADGRDIFDQISDLIEKETGDA